MEDQQEVWRTIPGWEGLYEASTHGRIFSLRTGRVLKSAMNRRHRHVALARGDQGRSYRVHKIVAETFIGPCPDGMEVLHRDDDPDNNRIDNLHYGTRSENMLDRVRLGTHHYSRRDQCKQGHPYTAENTLPSPSGRRCRECKRAHGRAYARKKRAGV